MENTTNNDENRNNSVPMNPNISEYASLEGYLEKKGRNIFAGWQKRYFRCLEGKIIIFTESKENKELKGYIQIRKISYIKSIDEKTFIFESDDREYLLRADNEGIKNKWVSAITYLMELTNQRISKDINNYSVDFNKSQDNIIKKMKNKEENIKTISKKNADLIKKYGYIINKEDPLSKQLLETKGINKLININDPRIILRVHYGFCVNIKKFLIFSIKDGFLFFHQDLY